MAHIVRVTAGKKSISLPDGNIYDGQVDVTLTDAQFMALGPNVFTSGLLVDMGSVADPATDAVFATDAQATSAASSAAGAVRGLQLAVTAVKTSAYTAAPGELVPVDTTSSAVTVTLPTAPADKTVVAVKHVVQSGTRVVTIACGGSDVFNRSGGAASMTLPTLAQAAVMQYQASTHIWYVIADDIPLAQLDLRYSGRLVAAQALRSQVEFGTSGAGHVLGTAIDTGLTVSFDIVNTKALRFVLSGAFAFKNGTVKFVGSATGTVAVVCTASPTPADVGLTVMTAPVKTDRPTASAGAVSASFEIHRLFCDDVFTIGSGGILNNQLAQGTGYTFKVTLNLIATGSAAVITTNILASMTPQGPGLSNATSPSVALSVVEA